MDCEKFESHLIDELYDELDEVTSAATKRHVAGCARCASLLSGMKATRRLAVLPIVEPPADLEDRILAAAKEAQKVVPIQSRMSRAISWAASRAMQPQTAMAALFLICIGTSALFLKGRSSKPPSSAVSVQEEGAPATAVAAAPSVARPEAPATPADEKLANLTPTPATGPAPAPAAATASALALDDDTAMRRSYAVPPKAGKPSPVAAEGQEYASSDSVNAFGASNAGAVAGAPGASKKEAHASGSIGGGGAGGPSYAPPPPAPAAQAAPAQNAPINLAQQQAAKDQAPLSDFDRAKQAYADGDYSGARDQFATLAATTGGLDAALWQAKSEEGANGCVTALPLYNDVTRRGPATRAGYDAQLAAGRCYRVMGDVTNARAKLVPLLGVPSHMARAQSELNAMAPRGGSGQAARAAPQPKAAAPPPAATAVDQAY
jgi:hypothetical protein